MRKKFFILGLALILVFCSAAGAFADVDPKGTSSVRFSIDRTSGYTADASAVFSFSYIVDEYSVVVYLQKLVNGQWVNDTSNDDYVSYNNGFNSASFLYSHTYDDLSYGTTYRLYCVSRDIINGIESRSTTYSNSF